MLYILKWISNSLTLCSLKGLKGLCSLKGQFFQDGLQWSIAGISQSSPKLNFMSKIHADCLCISEFTSSIASYFLWTVRQEYLDITGVEDRRKYIRNVIFLFYSELNFCLQENVVMIKCKYCYIHTKV